VQPFLLRDSAYTVRPPETAIQEESKRRIKVMKYKQSPRKYKEDKLRNKDTSQEAYIQ
jgi:hypothetical protein